MKRVSSIMSIEICMSVQSLTGCNSDQSGSKGRGEGGGMLGVEM